MNKEKVKTKENRSFLPFHFYPRVNLTLKTEKNLVF